MEKVRYMISDAATLTGVESHVLRYWEDELELDIPRNELGHRYYTGENIAQFQKIKELKEQGYQLKAIKLMLHNADTMPEQIVAAPKGFFHRSGQTCLGPEDKMQQFRELMNDIVGHAIARNNEELSQIIGTEVQERVLKEMDYLMREQEVASEERFHKLDAAIRGEQKRRHLLFAKSKLGDAPRKEKKAMKPLEQGSL